MEFRTFESISKKIGLYIFISNYETIFLSNFFDLNL